MANEKTLQQRVEEMEAWVKKSETTITQLQQTISSLQGTLSSVTVTANNASAENTTDQETLRALKTRYNRVLERLVSQGYSKPDGSQPPHASL